MAVTGMGIVSCLGLECDAVSDALRAGQSGIVVDEERVAMGFRSPLTGQVVGYDPRKYVNRKQAKSMGQPAAFAVGAAVDAIEQSGLSRDALRNPRVGLIVGNDSCAQPAVQTADALRELKETRLLGSGRILQVMNSTVTINLGTFFGIQGASWTISGACASGAHSIGQAAMLIGSGTQDVVLCGGAQEINWQAMASFDALGGFALPGNDPKLASRPFDANRCGLVPSGGAAMVVLESLEHAQTRGARIFAEVLGYAFSSDGGHVTQPDGHGAVRAMRAALDHAQCSPHEVDYINAHATGTQVGDAVEGRAILEVFGGKSPPVSSTKSMTGHECWMAGASEFIYCLLMMRDAFMAPNINLSTLDPTLTGLDVITTTRHHKVRTVLSNSFGFGGTNAALLLRAVA